MIIKILDFFFLFLINLEKLQMLTHLDPFDVGASRDNAYVLRLAQLHSDAVDFQKRDICFMRKLCMIQIMRILDSSSMP